MLRTEQNEIARHQGIWLVVDDIRSGTVDGGCKLSVAVFMQNAVVVPQKSGDFVGR